MKLPVILTTLNPHHTMQTPQQIESEYFEALALAQECADSGNHSEAQLWSREADSLHADLWQANHPESL